MVVIKRCGVWSVSKFYGMVGFLIGVLVGLLEMFFVLFLSGLLSSMIPGLPKLDTLGIIIAIISPIIYGLFGLLTGALSALIYNLIAKIIGGIEIEIEEKKN